MLKLSLNPKASSSNGSIPTATEEHASDDFPVNTAQVSSGSSSIPNSPMSSEETFSPPPKTPSSPNDSCAVPSCKKGSQSSFWKPRKVRRSSADLLSSAKKPQPFTRPDPTSPAQNNNPQACPQANPSEKSVSNSQPSPGTGPPVPAPASTQPTSQATIASDSSNADSLPPPKCEGMTRFQCEHCGMNLSSRNCLYKHKKENTSRPTELMTMEEKTQEINMSFVQSAKKNKKGEINHLIPSFGTNIKKSHDKTTK